MDDKFEMNKGFQLRVSLRLVRGLETILSSKHQKKLIYLLTQNGRSLIYTMSDQNPVFLKLILKHKF